MSETKSRPILFSGPMVRAILDGRKTMTRRVVALPRKRGAFVLEDHGDGWWPYQSDDGESSVCNDGCEYPYSCPYGAVGDQLFVRENGWQRPERTPRMMREGADTWEPYYYDADGLSELDVEDFKRWGFKRRPSIHMPRWASRITLEITGVRVERLQEISEADAEAEGARGGHGAIPGYGYAATPVEHFRHIWESINGPVSWDANPWVWCVEFRRVT